MSEELNLRSDKVLSTVVTGLKQLIKRNPYVSGFYVLGILLALFAGGFQVDQSSAALFEHNLSSINAQTNRELTFTLDKLLKAERLYNEHKGWFSCDPECMKYYEQVGDLKKRLAELKENRNTLAKQAKMTVGVWSNYGISEIRNAFWDAWEQGKEAARRMTMFDSIFIALGSMGSYNNRDDPFLVTVLQILVQYIMNLTVGLFTSLVIFLIETWYIITSYGPSILSAVALFFLVVCSSVATVATAVGGLFGGLFGSVYFLMRNAEKRARLQQGSTRISGTHLHWE